VEDAELNCISAVNVDALFRVWPSDVRNVVRKGLKPLVSSPIELGSISNDTGWHWTLNNPYILTTNSDQKHDIYLILVLNGLLGE
jgi:hypothetical protein